MARRIGHQKHYQANAASPLFSELRSIVSKTVGLAEPLRDALKPLSSAIRAAFVYGSVAKATDQSASDVDLMIISDSLTCGELFGALEWVTRTMGRKINPTVYTDAEFSKRARTENAFVTRVRHLAHCPLSARLPKLRRRVSIHLWHAALSLLRRLRRLPRQLAVANADVLQFLTWASTAFDDRLARRRSMDRAGGIGSGATDVSQAASLFVMTVEETTRAFGWRA